MSPVWVFLGGGTGAVLRWWVSTVVASPWGTLVVNVLGSFLLAALAHPDSGLSHPWRLALGTGLMGGLTTYSTFNLEVLGALHAGFPGRAALIVVATLGACLAGGALGWALMSAVRG